MFIPNIRSTEQEQDITRTVRLNLLDMSAKQKPERGSVTSQRGIRALRQHDVGDLRALEIAAQKFQSFPQSRSQSRFD